VKELIVIPLVTVHRSYIAFPWEYTHGTEAKDPLTLTPIFKSFKVIPWECDEYPTARHSSTIHPDTCVTEEERTNVPFFPREGLFGSCS